MTVLFLYQVALPRSWLPFLGIRTASLLHRYSFEIYSNTQRSSSTSSAVKSVSQGGRVTRVTPGKVYEYPDWNAPISRKEFWKQHELWRVNKHFNQRQQFIDYQHEQLLMKCCVLAFFIVSGYLIFGTYSLQDNSARIFKSSCAIVKQSPIVRDLIGPHVFCFGTCGSLKKHPFYSVTPIDELGNWTILYMRFNVAGTSGRGVAELELKMEKGGKKGVQVEKFFFTTSTGESWELKRPGSNLQTMGFL